jgi:hypothetical protein
MDFSALLLSPIYDVLGVSASLTPNGIDAVAVSLTVLDKTAGVDISSEFEITAIRPAASARLSDLAALGIADTELDGGSITFNGSTWRIDMHLKRPTPDGFGEMLMMLMDEVQNV